MKRVDLHLHSRFSDGTLAPAELVARGREAGLDLMALTDHDGVAGFPEARRAAEGAAGPRVLCGIEISSSVGEVHILGYGLDHARPAFAERVSELHSRRRERVRRMVEKLQGLKFPITMEEVVACSGGVLGRPHIADALCRKGIASNRGEAFGRWLAEGRPAFVPSMGPAPEEAIAMIRDAGGFAVLAHPDTVEDLGVVGGWVKGGLEGLEAHYPTYAPAVVKRFAELAAGHGLLLTGGSDCHGPGTLRNAPLGVSVPDAVVERFLERVSRCG
ncbi:MAG: PHP domain-containing protein [Elusimicrobia bacterium]|nr:PHP domain-containing protein [Elusimicrobiota bacterium]